MSDLLKIIGLGLIALLPLVNPLTTVALFLGMSGGMSPARRKSQIRRASVYVFIIMTVTWYAGQLVMDTFGISVPGLRIAGGMIVAFIGFSMLFPSRSGSPETSTDARTPDIAFIPLAMPSSAGPGTIAMIVSAAATARTSPGIPDWVILAAPPLVFLAVAIILWLCLLSAGTIMRLTGKSGIDAISRLMGFLLVCMGVQFIINGVLEIASTHTGTL